jgi:hypothetical protein
MLPGLFGVEECCCSSTSSRVGCSWLPCAQQGACSRLLLLFKLHVSEVRCSLLVHLVTSFGAGCSHVLASVFITTVGCSGSWVLIQVCKSIFFTSMGPRYRHVTLPCCAPLRGACTHALPSLVALIGQRSCGPIILLPLAEMLRNLHHITQHYSKRQ